MNLNEQKCGVVAILGAPNAGKSTLTNALVGQKVAITSAKPQTTRTRAIGVAIEGNVQIILTDTPGIFTPHRRLDRAMAIRRGAWLRDYVFDFITTFAPPLTKALVQRALAAEPGEAFEL